MKTTLLSFVFGVLLLLPAAPAFAQQLRLAAYLRDSITHYPVKGVLTNIATGKQVTTTTGLFRLHTRPGERYRAAAPGYRSDTLVIPGLYADTLELFLAPTGVLLGNVTVQAQYNRYQLDSVQRRRSFDSMRGNAIPTVSKADNMGFGVGLNLDRVFKSKDRRKLDQEAFFARREKDAFIDYYFSPYLVSSYTGLKGAALSNFMYRYRPEYEWLRYNHHHDALLLYVNDALKKEKK